MSELFDDDAEEDKVLSVEEELIEPEDLLSKHRQAPISDARRRLEKLLEEKRLRDELEDFMDY